MWGFICTYSTFVHHLSRVHWIYFVLSVCLVFLACLFVEREQTIQLDFEPENVLWQSLQRKEQIKRNVDEINSKMKKMCECPVIDAPANKLWAMRRKCRRKRKRNKIIKTNKSDLAGCLISWIANEFCWPVKVREKRHTHTQPILKPDQLWHRHQTESKIENHLYDFEIRLKDSIYFWLFKISACIEERECYCRLLFLHISPDVMRLRCRLREFWATPPPPTTTTTSTAIGCGYSYNYALILWLDATIKIQKEHDVSK